MLGGTSTRYLKQTITHYAVSGTDDDGKPTHSADGTEIACRIDSKKEKFIDPEGREVISTAQIIVDGDNSIDSDDKIKLADDTYPIILAVEGNIDANGSTHHLVIYT